MTTTRHKTLESPKGVGVVYLEDDKIADVRYDLKVRQKLLVGTTFKETYQLDGTTSAEGSLIILEGQKLSMDKGGRLILELDDRRRMEFLVVNLRVIAVAGSTSERYRIVRTGGWIKAE